MRRILFILAILALLVTAPIQPANADVASFSDDTGKGVTKTYSLPVASGAVLVVGGWQIANSSDPRLNGTLPLIALAGPINVSFQLTDGFVRISDVETQRAEFCVRSKQASYNVRDLANYGQPCTPPSLTPTIITETPYYEATGSTTSKSYAIEVKSNQVLIAGGGNILMSNDPRFNGELVFFNIAGPTTARFTLTSGFITVVDTASSQQKFCARKGGAPYKTVVDTIGINCSATPIPTVIPTTVPSRPTRLFLGEIRKDPPTYSVGYYEPTGQGITKDFNGTVPAGMILIAGAGASHDLSGLTPELNSDESVLISVKGPFLFQVRIASGFIKIVADSDGRAEFCKRGDQAWRSGVPYRGYIVEYSGFPTNPCST